MPYQDNKESFNILTVGLHAAIVLIVTINTIIMKFVTLFKLFVI